MRRPNSSPPFCSFLFSFFSLSLSRQKETGTCVYKSARRGVSEYSAGSSLNAKELRNRKERPLAESFELNRKVSTRLKPLATFHNYPPPSLLKHPIRVQWSSGIHTRALFPRSSPAPPFLPFNRVFARSKIESRTTEGKRRPETGFLESDYRLNSRVMTRICMQNLSFIPDELFTFFAPDRLEPFYPFI